MAGGWPPPPRKDWFSKLFGFAETDYETAKSWLKVDGNKLTSLANERAFEIGSFGTPSVHELAAQCSAGARPDAVNGTLRATIQFGDIKEIIANPANKNATVQVASQFNCLEFISAEVIPEQGITPYEHDRTQGPACSIACGAATAYRNYFYPFPSGQIGQTEFQQINNLSGVLAHLAPSESEHNQGAMSDPHHQELTVINGYSFASDGPLSLITNKLDKMTVTEEMKLRRELRVGVHSDVEVTISAEECVGLISPGEESEAHAMADEGSEPHTITQVFASACAVAYSGNEARMWAAFARLVLRGAYEATLYAGLLNYIKCIERGGDMKGGNIVYLTLLGGGVFGNPVEWIVDAIWIACTHPDIRSANLDVRINIFSLERQAPPQVVKLVKDLQAAREAGWQLPLTR